MTSQTNHQQAVPNRYNKPAEQSQPVDTNTNRQSIHLEISIDKSSQL